MRINITLIGEGVDVLFLASCKHYTLLIILSNIHIYFQHSTAVINTLTIAPQNKLGDEKKDKKAKIMHTINITCFNLAQIHKDLYLHQKDELLC